jgi:hypothetical protein
LSGFSPKDLGKEQRNCALSKSILSNSRPLGIETFFKSSLTVDLDFLVFFFFFTSFSISTSA